MRISTRSGPNSLISGARSDAHDGLGASRVPRSASVRMLSFSSGFRLRASCSVSISSCSERPMYKVDKKMRFFALLMRSCEAQSATRSCLIYREALSHTDLERFVEIGRCSNDVDSVALDVEPRRQTIELADYGRQCADSMARACRRRCRSSC